MISKIENRISIKQIANMQPANETSKYLNIKPSNNKWNLVKKEGDEVGAG